MEITKKSISRHSRVFTHSVSINVLGYVLEGINICRVLALSIFFLQFSCEPPFEGITPILTNNQVDRIISIQVLDANSNAVNIYPENTKVTLSGQAIEQGLLYYADGSTLGTDINLVENSVNVAVRPGVEIAADTPLVFTIIANADGYLSNSTEVKIGVTDKTKYVSLGLVNLSDLPDGVTAITEISADIVDDVPVNDIVFAVADFDDTEGNELKVQITFEGGTSFKDENGNDISGNQLSTQLTYFDGVVDQAVLAATGGRGNAVLEDGSVAVINGLVNVSAFLNTTAIRSFSTPVKLDIFLTAGSFNPKTNQLYSSGDEVNIVSRDNPGDFFVNEGTFQVVLDEVTNRLKVSYNALHFTDYAIASIGVDKPVDDSSIVEQGSGEVQGGRLFEYRIRYEANGQLIASGNTVGETPEFVLEQLKGQVPDLPADIVLEIYENGLVVINKVFLANEVIAITSVDVIQNVNTLPVLNFNLETQCSDGVFRYTGPIQYRIKGTQQWLQFSNAVEGLLTTQLLDWGRSYEFRVIYRGQSFVRTREVIQGDFRINGDGAYDYWGPDEQQKRVFFNAPIACN